MNMEMNKDTSLYLLWVGPQGIVSRLFQQDKPRRGHQPRTHIPGARPKRPRTN